MMKERRGGLDDVLQMAVDNFVRAIRDQRRWTLSYKCFLIALSPTSSSTFLELAVGYGHSAPAVVEPGRAA
jgi:hypothetical protein